MKSRNYINITLSLLFLTSCMNDSKVDSCKIGILKKNYQLVWSDLFVNETLDTTKWNIEIRDPRWVNNELQAYTDKQNNIYIDNN